MRQLILASLWLVAACGGTSATNEMPDLASCTTQPCTCAADTSCVMIQGFSSFCAPDCVDDRDCAGEEQCVALLRGSTFSPKTCVKAARFLLCTTPASCDLGTTQSCDGDVLLSPVTLTQGVCGRASVFCPGGCTAGACN